MERQDIGASQVNGTTTENGENNKQEPCKRKERKEKKRIIRGE